MAYKDLGLCASAANPLNASRDAGDSCNLVLGLAAPAKDEGLS